MTRFSLRALVCAGALLGSAAGSVRAQEDAPRQDPKEFTSLELKYFAPRDERFQFGFDFSWYKEFELDFPVMPYAQLRAYNVMEPPGSFKELRFESNPEWQPHFLEFDAQLGLSRQMYGLVWRAYIAARRKMFVDYPHEPAMDGLLGASVESEGFLDKGFEPIDDLAFAGGLEWKLAAGSTIEGDAFFDAQARLDFLQWQSAMFALETRVRAGFPQDVTDFSWGVGLSARAQNGTALVLGIEKYHRVPLLFTFGLRLGGAIDHSKEAEAKGLFFWPLSSFHLPRFDGELRALASRSEQEIQARARTYLVEFKPYGMRLRGWLEALLDLKGEESPDRVYYDLNAGVEFDAFSDKDWVPVVELGWYHTSYHILDEAVKRPDSVNWLGGYVVSKGFFGLLRDAGFVEYRLGGGMNVQSRTKIGARLDAAVRLPVFQGEAFSVGPMADLEVLIADEPAFAYRAGIEAEWCLGDDSALFGGMGYFKRDPSELSAAYLQGEGVLAFIGFRY